MTHNTNRLELLADRYFDATITQAEEQELREMLIASDELPADLQALKVMVVGLDALRCEAEPADETIAAPKVKRKGRIIRLIGAASSIAAAVAVILLSSVNNKPADEELIYCYINGEPVTDLAVAMEQTKYLEPIKEISQSVATLESIMNIKKN